MVEVKKALIMQFKVKDIGELHYFLGVKIIQNRGTGEVWIGQSSYAENLLQKFGMQDAQPVHTPVETGTKLMKGTEDYNGVDRKSTSGYLFQINGAAVSWRSKKQVCVELSTAEAEYMALSSAVQKALWMRQLTIDLRNGPARTTAILEGNQSAISMTKNPQFHGCAKHIEIKYHFIPE